MDPQLSHTANGNYLIQQLFKGLYTYTHAHGLKLLGARTCTRTGRQMKCLLNPDHRWSTGQAIQAQDYLKAFRRLVDPKTASPQSDLLDSIRNAVAIRQGKANVESLGVVAATSTTLVFDFSEPDPEFEYKLALPALAPQPPGLYPKPQDAKDLVVSGPYQISKWKTGSYIRFQPNPFYPIKIENRPVVEAWFVDDDSAALRLYESGKLDFLRRLTASEIPRFKGTPEFHQIPMARFDYLGFGPELLKLPTLRKALVKGVEFKTYLKIIDTLSPPGCPSLPHTYLDEVHCMQPDFKTAKALLKPLKIPKLELHFSRMGGDDIALQAEWFQGQWRRHLKLNIELRSQEQGGYLNLLRMHPPALFRKGVSLDRPTCLAALEVFFRNNPENYLKISDPEFERLAQKTAEVKTPKARQVSCRKAVARLFESNQLIPLGEMYFTILANSKFKGWDLSELNQLDLSELEPVAAPK